MFEKGNGSQEGSFAECDDPTSRSPNLGGIQSVDSPPLSGTKCTIPSSTPKHKICKCGKGFCKILTSKKDQSRGRMFYCCPQSTGVDNYGCGMFEWVIMEGSPSSSNGSLTEVGDHATDLPGVMSYNSSMYARGYLEGVIRGSELQTQALKDVLTTLNKLDIKKN